MRGEYKRTIQESLKYPGSPPLARGILPYISAGLYKSRITPACAGNTSTLPFYRCSIWDHPRLRGEYSLNVSILHLKVGSPPLARGILRSFHRNHRGCRITPACAGNTQSLQGKKKRGWDHPRLRGEYLHSPLFECSVLGSPPLARGILHKIMNRVIHIRITPACAGNTRQKLATKTWAEDHPRLRGEYPLRRVKF